MKQVKKSKFFKTALVFLLSVVLLQTAEYCLHRCGLELRTVAQEVKGIYVWLIASPIIIICLYCSFHPVLEGRREIWCEVLFALGLAGWIIGAGVRGLCYYAMEMMVEESSTVVPREEYFVAYQDWDAKNIELFYYEKVGSIFRRPFAGWTTEEVTEILEERYGEVTLVSTGEDGKITYTAPSIRPEGEPITFQAERNYTVYDTLPSELMKRDVERFWENRHRLVMLEDDVLTVRCFAEEDIAACAGDIVDWICYALEDERYYEGEWIPGQEEDNTICDVTVAMGGQKKTFYLQNEFVDREQTSWEDMTRSVMEELAEKLAPELLSDANGAETNGMDGADADEIDATSADALFMEYYDDEYYEKECLVGDGTLRYRMVVRDAACGSRAYSLLKSNDSGVTWEMASGMPFGEQWGQGIDFVFLDENFGFATLMHNGGDEAELYVTEDAGLSYQSCLIQGIDVSLSDGTLYNPYDYPQMPYEQDHKLYVLCGQGADGDYNGGDERGMALCVSTDGGHIFSFVEIVGPNHNN